MLRHLGYPEAADRVETAVRDVIAEGETTTYDLGGTAGTSAVRRRDHRPPRRAGVRSRRAAIDRSSPSMTALRRSRRASRAGNRPHARGLRRDAAAATAGGSRPRSRAIALHGLRHVPVLQRDRLDAAVRDAPYEVDGYLSPLFSPLIAPGLAADLDQPGPAHPVDPARLPGHLLLLPQGLLPLLLRRPAGLRGRRADGPPRLRDGDGLPVHPPEPPPLLPVPRVHPAVLPVGRRGPARSVHDGGSRGSAWAA